MTSFLGLQETGMSYGNRETPEWVKKQITLALDSTTDAVVEYPPPLAAPSPTTAKFGR